MTIDEVEKGLPNGFHDANLISIKIDYLKHEAELAIEVDISDPESEQKDYNNSSRAGKLILYGLLFCVIEPPDPLYNFPKIEGLWISDSGLIESTNIPAVLPKTLPSEVFSHYFFINNWNAFIYLAAIDARWHWNEEP